MSHTPPIPEASIAPFPIHPAPHGAEVPNSVKVESSPASDDKTRLVIAGAAVGIGSAAIVAALLYANRKPGKATKPVTPRPHAD